ncbi:MAG: UDP-N-acetyl-D-galactosamine dehydrogenase [Pelagibacteraceae bacterium]|nr:UDP-N-acetyl-D-galactosamine dehydrogenase [Pelagibacteraceae bacterium]
MLKNKIGIIGLGYVGLPLAIEFSKHFKTIGYDLNVKRVEELNRGMDSTLEINNIDLINRLKTNLIVTDKINELKSCNYYIVTVPTPVDENKNPDFGPLKNASKIVSKILKRGDTVIVECTVYPGATEEICVPIIERNSNLTYNKDFFMGYSPERINPGDKERTLSKIVKITSGSNPEVAKKIDNLYKKIIKAGTFRASSIKVAEAAKVIENSQRDINIAFVNELSKIFNLIGIDTNEVLDAACTKWNFLNFRPGLVGGHCIGVDPYYLAKKSLSLGYNPEIILSGRRLNDSMSKFVAHQLIELMKSKKITVKNSNILILGYTFKENCPDHRNTKVLDIYLELKKYNTNLSVVDPWVDSDSLVDNISFEIYKNIPNKKFDAVLLAVCHNDFKNLDLNPYLNSKKVVYDLKGFLNKDIVDLRL